MRLDKVNRNSQSWNIMNCLDHYVNCLKIIDLSLGKCVKSIKKKKDTTLSVVSMQEAFTD